MTCTSGIKRCSLPGLAQSHDTWPPSLARDLEDEKMFLALRSLPLNYSGRIKITLLEYQDQVMHAFLFGGHDTPAQHKRAVGGFPTPKP